MAALLCPSTRGGYTLIGALASVGIILLLTALLIPAAVHLRARALERGTASEVIGLRLAIARYAAEARRLPPEGIEGVVAALEPRGLYAFPDGRKAPPAAAGAQAARLAAALADAEGRIADAQARAADLQRAMAEGAGGPSPDPSALAAARAEAIARAAQAVESREFQRLEEAEGRFGNMRERRDLSPAEAEELAAVQESLAPYRRAIEAAMGYAGLGRGGPEARLSDASARLDSLRVAWGKWICDHPGTAYAFLMDVYDRGERSPIYLIGIHSSNRNLGVTEEFFRETRRHLRETQERWVEERGETIDIGQIPLHSFGCVHQGLMEYYNWEEPTLRRWGEEIAVTRYLRERFLDQVVEDGIPSPDGNPYNGGRAKAAYGGSPRDSEYYDVAVPCLRERLEADPAFRADGEYPPIPGSYATTRITPKNEDPPYPALPPAIEGTASGGAEEAALAELRVALDALDAERARLQAELAALAGSRVYLDLYGNPFRYGLSAEDGAFFLFSAGPDGVPGTGDDVTGG